MSVYDNPIIFDLVYKATNVFCASFGIVLVEQRQRIASYKSILKFYIFSEKTQHNRLHFHAFINDEKVASIYLDNFEVDFFNSKVKKNDQKNILDWVKHNTEHLKKIKLNEDGSFEIPFIE